MKASGDSDEHDIYFRVFKHTTRLSSAVSTVQSIETNRVTVSRLVAVPARKVFVAACLDFVLRVYPYNAVSAIPTVLSGGHRGAVMDVIHLHDDVVASVAVDGSICTWRIPAPSNIKSPSSVALVDSLRLENERALSIASLNSNHIVVGTESGKLVILKHRVRGEALHVAKTLAHGDAVLRIAAMENDYFVSVSRDKTARVWNTTNIPALHNPIATLAFDSAVVSCEMNHEHHLIALGTANGALHVYYISDTNSVEKVFQTGDVDFCLNSIRFVTNDILAIACLSGCVVFASISRQKVTARLALDRNTFLMDTAPLDDGRLVAVGMSHYSAVFQMPSSILKGQSLVEESIPTSISGVKKKTAEIDIGAGDDNLSIRSSKKVDPLRSTSSKRGMRIKGGPVLKSGSAKKGIRTRNGAGGTAAAAAGGGDDANDTLVLRKGASNGSLSAMADEARRLANTNTSPNPEDDHVVRKGTASNNSLNSLAAIAGEKSQANKDRPRGKSQKRDDTAVVRPSTSRKGIRRRNTGSADDESHVSQGVSSSGSKKGIRKGRSTTGIPRPKNNDKRSHSTLGHGDDVANVKANLRPAQPPALQFVGTRARGYGSNGNGNSNGIGGIGMTQMGPTSIPTSPVSGKLDPPLPFAPKKDAASPPPFPLPSSIYRGEGTLPSTIVANQTMAPVASAHPQASTTASKAAQYLSAATASASKATLPTSASNQPSLPPVLPPPSPANVNISNMKALPKPPPVLPPPSPSQPASLPPPIPSKNAYTVPSKLRSTPSPPPPAPAFGSRLIPPPLTKSRSPPTKVHAAYCLITDPSTAASCPEE